MYTLITSIFDSINALNENIFFSDPMLTNGLADGIPALYQYATAAQQVVLPIGYAILSLFFLLALLNCAQKVESAGGGVTMGVQMIAGTLVKLGLCKLLIDSVAVLMTAIFDGINYISVTIQQNVAITAPPIFSLDLDVGFFERLAMEFNIIGGLPKLLLALIVLLLMAVVWLISRVMIYLRFIEAYLYLIIAPVPLATLPGGEWGQIGKNFLKSFAAVAIQGTLLFLTLTFYPVIAAALVSNMSAGSLFSDEVLTALLQEAFYGVLLIFALAGTTRLARSICNAM